jgi:hypothetical protein
VVAGVDSAETGAEARAVVVLEDIGPVCACGAAGRAAGGAVGAAGGAVGAAGGAGLAPAPVLSADPVVARR